jgi:hypothetical protein
MKSMEIRSGSGEMEDPANKKARQVAGRFFFDPDISQFAWNHPRCQEGARVILNSADQR